MRITQLDLSPTSRARVILFTVLGTVACIGTVLLVDSFNFPNQPPEQVMRQIITDFLLPIGLAGPTIYFLTSKLRELAIAHEQLTKLAATDSLTTVLNRGAFTTLVDAYLSEVKTQERATTGALLVIDADNFKAINDNFGHDRGDEALKIIARAIQGVLRSVDIVGRIGGEEFGVFLPNSSVPQAEAVAERIRVAVNQADFTPAGVELKLSVSVGGATFDRQLPFADLFRLADQQLYVAKQEGRNRVVVSPVQHYGLIPSLA